MIDANHMVNHMKANIRVTTSAPEKNWAGCCLAKLKSVLIMCSCFDDRANVQCCSDTKKFILMFSKSFYWKSMG
jgi:hypothetical protein